MGQESTDLMSSQPRRHRKLGRVALKPVVLVLAVAAVLVSAIVGVNVLTSKANASSRASSSPSSVAKHGKGGKGSNRQTSSDSATPSAATPSATPTDAGAVSGGAPSASSPLAQLPPAYTSPAASPSDSAAAPAATSAAPAAPAAQPSTQTAQATAEANRVGALFSNGVSAGNHFCTASVLDSPTKNLLLTAAHCLDSASGVQFAPGYRNGQAPFGSWQVTQIYTTTGWSQNGDQDQDFAILQVAPNSSGKQIEDVVGANPLGTNENFTATVRLYGYPDNTDAPILCTNATTQQAAYQRRIDCPSYPSGTSGGPWISTTTGNVIGIIGGYQQGGSTDDTSYSAYFDQTIAGLYKTAVSSAG